MSRNKVKYRKKPSEYPQFNFRISVSDREWLKEELDSIKNYVDKNREYGAAVITKSDIIMDALRIGLGDYKKKIK